MNALVIIDMQNDYFPDGKMELVGAVEAAKQARLVLDEFRRKDLPVFHIQHISLKKGATFFLPNTKGVEINDWVKPIASEKIIQKNYPNSFHNTSLFAELKSVNINSLIICGMMTHMCIDATTRAAFDLGFNCTLLHNACATKDLMFQDKKISADNVHAAFLAALHGVYAQVISVEEYLLRTI